MTMAPNRPSPEGAALGAQLARLTEHEMAKLRSEFPNHLEPCESCAFRRGTVPNRCLPTVMDALKCVMEGRDFYCHQSPKDGKGTHTGLCTGYMIAMTARDGAEPIPTPWPFSYDDDEPEPVGGVEGGR